MTEPKAEVSGSAAGAAFGGRWPDDDRAALELNPNYAALVRLNAPPQLELSFAGSRARAG